MRVAVTGANGFVGRHAIARLLLGGHEVRALISERPGAEKELPGGGTNVDVRRADVRKPESLRGAFDGVDAVIIRWPFRPSASSASPRSTSRESRTSWPRPAAPGYAGS